MLNNEEMKELLSTARAIEKCSERCRVLEHNYMTNALRQNDELSVVQKGTSETMKYCGAMLSLMSSVLCDLVSDAQAKRASRELLGRTNCVLREWGLDELS